MYSNMTPKLPRVIKYGPVAKHDQPCHVCWTASAVYDLNTQVFQPCWTCQQKGWKLKRKPRWRRKWLN